MPKIFFHGKLCDQFIEGLTEKYGKERTDIHVADLVYCLRQAFFKKTKPKKITEVELNFYVDGANRHTNLQMLTNVKHEVHVEKYGVHGTIDLYGDNKEPIEIKSTRAKNGISPHYLRQLGYYCVLSGSLDGHLIIQRILNKYHPWEWYHISFTPEEFAVLERDMIKAAEQLRQAFNENTHTKLPLTSYQWKCNDCRWIEECNIK